MATFVRFEEIQAWQTGRQLRRMIYGFTRKPAFSADRDLVSQIRSAAQSITSNIAEGYERAGNREFIQFLSVAKGSLAEVKDQLYTAIDEHYIDQPEFDAARKLADIAAYQIGGLIRYLKQTQIRGSKYKARPSETQNAKP